MSNNELSGEKGLNPKQHLLTQRAKGDRKEEMLHLKSNPTHTP